MSRLNYLFREYSGETIRITEEQMSEFLSLCLGKAGADSMVTPREIIRSYLTLLQLMRQNPEASFTDLLSDESVSKLSAISSETDEGIDESSELDDFTL